MKTLSFAVVLMSVFYCSNGQPKKVTNSNTYLSSLKKEKSSTDKYEFEHRKQLIVLAKIQTKSRLVRINNEDFPDNTDIIYTILKDSNGRIIAIEQIPYSESGDWYEEFKHYFDVNGNTFSFSVKTTIFDDSVKGGVAMWQAFNYYTPKFDLLSKSTALTDSKENPLKGRKDSEFDFRHDRYHTYTSVNECLKAFHIDRSQL